jgi:hypothetical protein
MDLMTAKTLIDIGNNLGIELGLYKNYNTPYNTTTGVIATGLDSIPIIVEEFNTVTDGETDWVIRNDNGDEVKFDLSSVRIDIHYMNRDNLGKQSYVYY